MLTKFLLLLCTFGLMLGLAGCSPQVAPALTYIIPPSINPGDPIPPPSGEVILTISGDVSVTNVDDTLQLDMPTLERLGLVKYSLVDPYSNEDAVFTGVLMSDLVKVLGITDSSKVLHLVALDDYQVDLTMAQTELWPIILATRNNDEYITVDNSGPTRIIFPYDVYPELDPGEHVVDWIWSVSSIRVD